MKKSILIVLMMSLLLLCSCGSEKEAKNDEPEIDYAAVSADMSNFSCDGTGCLKDGWLYNLDFDDNTGAPRFVKQRTDRSDYSIITKKGAASYIHIDGEFIYFVLGTEDSTSPYRCRLGGDDLERLGSDNIIYLQVTDDFMYYDKYDPDTGKTTGFYRCDKEGKNEEPVLDKEIYYSYVVGNQLYYQDDNDGETIHIYDLETKEDEKLTDSYSYCFIRDEKYGYYLKNDKSTVKEDYTADVVKIDLETKEETVLYENAETLGGLQVYKDRIYFSNSNDDCRIYSIDKNGDDIQLVTQDRDCMYMTIYEDKLMYRAMDKKEGYVNAVNICNLDGTDKITLAE